MTDGPRIRKTFGLYTKFYALPQYTPFTERQVLRNLSRAFFEQKKIAAAIVIETTPPRRFSF